jgi:hypothetical protein
MGVLPAASDGDLVATIGLVVHQRRFVLVEDEVAALLCHAIFSEHIDGFDRLAEIVVTGSDGHVLKALQHTPLFDGGVLIAGVFDGDMRAKHGSAVTNWRFSFLPGSEPYESQLEEMLRDSGSSVAARLGVDAMRLKAHLASIEGLDLHDWMHDLAKGLRMRVGEIVSRMHGEWAAIGNRAEESRLLADFIRSQLKLD